jgi:AraC-like DNA-binding protein
MDNLPHNAPITEEDCIAFFRSLFEKQLNELNYNKHALYVPSMEDLFWAKKGMAYHFKPEIFLQVGGRTEFTFPNSNKSLCKGEICVMPRGVVHGESITNKPDPFQHMVICFYNKTITMHIAYANEKGLPKALKVLFFKTDLFSDSILLLDRIASLYHSKLSYSKTAMRGLLMGFFALMLNVLEGEYIETKSESHRVNQCQWLIRNHLNDPDLSVAGLAEQLQCSPNYLSKLFHDEMGEKITAYINRIRLKNANLILKETTLSVKEIAYACGFRNPNYFSRIFKQVYGNTPHDFRISLLNSEHTEKQPKVVYDDHEEFHYGVDLFENPIKEND